MKTVIQEQHNMREPGIPFIFHTDTIRKDGLFVHYPETGENARNPNGLYVHRHENVEFLCCLEGCGILYSDSSTIEMHPGDIVVINSNRIHSVITQSAVKYHCLIVSNEYFKENLIDVENLSFSEKIQDEEAFRLISTLENTYKNRKNTYFVAENRNVISTFMLHVVKNHTETVSDSLTPSKKQISLLTAFSYIDMHLSEKLTLESIAEISGYSKFHFARIFKEVTGTTVIDYIKSVRCDKAKTLLLETSDSVTQICNACGFENSSYFTRTFKKFYRCTPLEFRKKYAKLK